MQKYGLKVASPYEKKEETVITGHGDIVLTETGVYRIKCIGDTYVHHNVTNNMMHVTCESAKDDIEIHIKSNGQVNDGEVADVYHSIIAKHKNVKTNIESRGVANGTGRIIYRSSLGSLESSSGEGKQSGKFLILDNNAEVDAEPSLDIASDTFPTTHAVSVSGIDNEKLFYMKSAGLSQKEAEDEIVSGFLNC